MKLINAGIKTEEEMYIRMVKGEIFDYKDCTILFKDRLFSVVNDRGNTFPLTEYSRYFKDFMVKQDLELKDSLSAVYKPLCWVSNFNNESKKEPIRIIDFDHDKGFYIDIHGNYWEYATPIEVNELRK